MSVPSEESAANSETPVTMTVDIPLDANGLALDKEELKRDAESQALENVVGVVFVTHYLQDFVAGHGDYDEAKLLGILRKTMRKLDGVGHSAIRDIPLPAAHKALIEKSLPGAGDDSH